MKYISTVQSAYSPPNDIYIYMPKKIQIIKQVMTADSTTPRTTYELK